MTERFIPLNLDAAPAQGGAFGLVQPQYGAPNWGGWIYQKKG